jgi:hypothetical protein
LHALCAHEGLGEVPLSVSRSCLLQWPHDTRPNTIVTVCVCFFTATFLQERHYNGAVVIRSKPYNMHTFVTVVAATLLVASSEGAFRCFDDDPNAESYLLGATCSDVANLGSLLAACGNTTASTAVCTPYDFGSGTVNFVGTCEAVPIIKQFYEAYYSVKIPAGAASSSNLLCDEIVPYLYWPTPAKCKFRSNDIPSPYRPHVCFFLSDCSIPVLLHVHGSL